MSHEIESMMFVGETPWHGLGVKVTGSLTASEAIRAAGLNWGVRLDALKLPDGRDAIPYVERDPDDDETPSPYRATVRESDGRILGVVGPDYQPLQNADAFGFFDPWISSGSASYHTAGSLRGGRRIWVLAQANLDPLEIVRGDAVQGFILLSSSHDGTMAVRVGFTPIRVVCANTLAMAHGDGRSKLLRVRHTAGVVSTLDEIRETMDLARVEFAATADQYRSLAAKQVDRRTLEAYVKSVFRRTDAPTGMVLASQAGAGADESDGKRTVPRVMNLIEGGLRGDKLLPAASTNVLNFWRGYNAVTEYIDHDRGGDSAARLDSAWFNGGAEVKRRALDLAVKFAA